MRTPRGPLSTFLVPPLAVAAVTAAKELLSPYVHIGTHTPYLMFSGAIMLAAWVGGFLSGLAATVLAALSVSYFFLPPLHSFDLDWRHAVTTIPFLAEGTVISAMAEALHRRTRLLADRGRVLEADRGLLEQRVAERTIELRELTAELMRAEQRERGRLSQVLHDGLQQYLVAAKMQVAAATRSPEGVGLARATELLDESIELSRTLAAQLSPPVLRQPYIDTSLQWLAEWMSATHGLGVRVEAVGPRFRAETDLRTFVFEATREMLLNVVKYAGATRAAVRLERDEGHVRVCVEDGGRGFDPSFLAEAGTPLHGTGLLAIRHRLELMGGRLDVDSAPGRGARVAFEVPIFLAEREDADGPMAAVRVPERHPVGA